ncbi:predicted protein [Sclerotinia sclerotiorum 1980 UF-70]|uniref:Uncharacterized protein n=1 Tax=Sclerotinia sclerotiorum (strain ATCC 18683 / 1980 / Ss-1) TaxID=665079 RepID=A7EHI0_SCLS1|nr:predicted protein [Sclerotinia sclerotiorum 1980 UF-70]EDO02296.1 predicted protein [Sclerotinia sclerotiorum 1980 UF-70]
MVSGFWIFCDINTVQQRISCPQDTLRKKRLKDQVYQPLTASYSRPCSSRLVHQNSQFEELYARDAAAIEASQGLVLRRSGQYIRIDYNIKVRKLKKLPGPNYTAAMAV